jgi:hypothetical protein
VEVSKVAVELLNKEKRAAGKVWYSGLTEIIFEKYYSLDTQILTPLSKLLQEMKEVSNITIL